MFPPQGLLVNDDQAELIGGNCCIIQLMSAESQRIKSAPYDTQRTKGEGAAKHVLRHIRCIRNVMQTCAVS